jgi:hypothetical protein
VLGWSGKTDDRLYFETFLLLCMSACNDATVDLLNQRNPGFGSYLGHQTSILISVTMYVFIVAF